MKRLFRFETICRVQAVVSDWISESPLFQNTLAATGRWFSDYRVSNMTLKPGWKDAPENPVAFSRDPKREFFLPGDMAERKRPIGVGQKVSVFVIRALRMDDRFRERST